MNSNKINFLFYSLGIVISGILSFLFIPVVVQMCGKEVYAVYSMIFNTLSIIAMFCYAWLGQSFIRFYSQQPQQLFIVSSRLLNKSLGVGFIVFLPVVFIVNSITIYELIWFIPTFFLFGYYCYYLLVFQARQKASLIMICEVLRTAINIVSTITLIKLFGNQNAIRLLAISLLLSYLFPLLILKAKNKISAIQLDKTETHKITKELIRFGIPIALFLSGSLALSVNDRFFISHLINKESAGSYAAIYDIINKGVTAVFSPVLMTFYPIIAKLYNDNKEQQAIKKLNKLIWLEIGLSSMGFIILIFCCPFLLKLIFKKDTSTHLQVVTYLIFIGVCLWQIAMLMHKPLELKQQTKFMAVAVFIALLVNATSNYLLLKNSNNLLIPSLTTIVGSVVYISIVLFYSNKPRLFR